MNKAVKYILVLLVVGLVAYKSVYFRKLSEVNKSVVDKFDPVVFANKLWDEQLPPRLDSAIELTSLVKLIESNPTDAFTRYSHVMGIGNYRYSLVKLSGIAAAINEDDVRMEINNADTLMKLILATEYIYGNAIRDASGLVDLRDFTNTADLNSISEELNKKVRNTVLPAFKNRVKQGDRITVTGVIQFNKEHIGFNHLELIPVRIEFMK